MHRLNYSRDVLETVCFLLVNTYTKIPRSPMKRQTNHIYFQNQPSQRSYICHEFNTSGMKLPECVHIRLIGCVGSANWRAKLSQQLPLSVSAQTSSCLSSI